MELLIWNRLSSNFWMTALDEATSEDYLEWNIHTDVVIEGLDFAFSKATQNNVLAEILIRMLCEDDNIWTRACLTDTMTEELNGWALRDVEKLHSTFKEVDWAALAASSTLPDITSIDVPASIKHFNPRFSQSIAAILAAKQPAEKLNRMAEHVRQFGIGSDSDCTAFRWENEKLIGIRNPDDISFDDLQHIDFQKEVLIENTHDFLAGNKANNVLLCGSMGSGKSSSVKAVLNAFKDKGLHAVEVMRNGFSQLPELLIQLEKRGGHYIVFIDDLSFDNNDEAYTSLKIALDGHLARPSRRILFYATSNRRNLVRDVWGDRAQSEEVSMNDTLNEKHSLAERFGIKLFFGEYSQQEYFDMIAHSLRSFDLAFDEAAKAEAILWERTYHTRSGRTAANFVKHYVARMGENA